MNWVRLGKKGRIDAFWGGQEAFDKLPKTWDKFPVLAKGQTPDGAIDYEDLKDESKAGRYALNHGYDESKLDSELGAEDYAKAAEFRGGSLVTPSSEIKKGELHTKLQWKCHCGHVFESTPFTILKAGFWCPECCEALPWAFDKAAAHVPFYAQVWYDTHSKAEENNVYPYDEHEDDDMIY